MRDYKHWTKLAAGSAVVVLAITTASWAVTQEAGGAAITVYATPTCGCCTKWGDHLRANGFDVTMELVSDLTQLKVSHGIGSELTSCHTAFVEGYVVEGHVPAEVIERLLEERPEVAGIAVPGMPQGSPGMEGDRHEAYEVLAFDREGTSTVYARR